MIGSNKYSWKSHALRTLVTLTMAVWTTAAHGFHQFSPPDSLTLMDERRIMRPQSTQAAHIRVVSIDRVGNSQVTEIYWLTSNANPDGREHLIRFIGDQTDAVVSIQTTAEGNTVWKRQGAEEDPSEVPAQQWQEGMLGMAATWDDLMDEKKDAFHYEFKGMEYLDGVAAARVVGNVRDRSASSKVARREIWIAREGNRSLKGNAFGDDYRLLKTFRASFFKKAPTPSGEIITYPGRLVIDNFTANVTSVAVVLENRFMDSLPEELFNVDYLKDWSAEKDQRIQDLVAGK